ncbi:MAG TPA: nitrogenase-stabilizing/protective protein NifW [Rhodocyclaceae bacterium]
METYDFDTETADCESAEDFLDHFGIAYDRAVLHPYRLHILQRFHDYLSGRAGKPGSFDDYRGLLERAYGDFVASDPQTEKVFRVFQRASGIATVPLTAIGRRAAS